MNHDFDQPIFTPSIERTDGHHAHILTAKNGSEYAVGQRTSSIFTGDPDSCLDKMEHVVRALFEAGVPIDAVVLEAGGVQITLDDLENFQRVAILNTAANKRARARLREAGLLPGPASRELLERMEDGHGR